MCMTHCSADTAHGWGGVKSLCRNFAQTQQRQTIVAFFIHTILFLCCTMINDAKGCRMGHLWGITWKLGAAGSGCCWCSIEFSEACCRISDSSGVNNRHAWPIHLCAFVCMQQQGVHARTTDSSRVNACTPH